MSQLNVTNLPQGNVPVDTPDNTNHVNAPEGQPPADLNNAHIGGPQQPRVDSAMHNNPLPDPRTVQLRGTGVNAGPQPAIGQQRTTSGEQVAYTAVRNAVAGLHQPLDDAQMPLVLKLLYKEIPGLADKVHSGNVGAIEAAIKGAGDKLATLVRNLPFHTAWEGSRERRAQLFAFQSRLDEATVQAAFFASPEVGNALANAYADLEEGKRPMPGTGDFDAWCDREIAIMLEAKLFAIRDLRKADLPEGAKHALLDKLLSGAVAGELGTFVATNAGPIAAKLNVDVLKNALRPLENVGQVDNAALLAALNAIDEQIPQILPALITYTPEERALLRDTVLQAFVQQHGELADLLARIPAAQVRDLGQRPGMTPERLGLLHAARGKAADVWLPTNIADAIRTGSTRLGTQQMLENVLRYGPELFRPHRKLPAHLHGQVDRPWGTGKTTSIWPTTISRALSVVQSAWSLPLLPPQRRKMDACGNPEALPCPFSSRATVHMRRARLETVSRLLQSLTGFGADQGRTLSAPGPPPSLRTRTAVPLETVSETIYPVFPLSGDAASAPATIWEPCPKASNCTQAK